MKPRLFIKQKITAFVNKYTIFEADEQGNTGRPLWYVQQKRLAFKEKVTFYDDEAHTSVAFTFRAEKVMDVHGKYFVEDSAGQVIGTFKKDFGASITNSTWHILSPGSEVVLYEVKENNQTLALLRRFAGFIPILGDLADIVVAFFRYHFVFQDVKTGEAVGKHQKTTLFYDNYSVSLTDEAYQAIGQKTAAAFGVALDALQSR